MRVEVEVLEPEQEGVGPQRWAGDSAGQPRLLSAQQLLICFLQGSRPSWDWERFRILSLPPSWDPRARLQALSSVKNAKRLKLSRAYNQFSNLLLSPDLPRLSSHTLSSRRNKSLFFSTSPLIFESELHSFPEPELSNIHRLSYPYRPGSPAQVTSDFLLRTRLWRRGGWEKIKEQKSVERRDLTRRWW